MLPPRGIEPRLTGEGESWPAAELLAAASMEVGRCGVDSGRGWAQSSPVRGGGGRGQGRARPGAWNRGMAAGVGRNGDGGELCSSSRRRKMGRRRRTRQRGRIRPATVAADRDARARNEDSRRVFQGWTPAKLTRGTPRCVPCTPLQRNDGPSGPRTRLSDPPKLGS